MSDEIFRQLPREVAQGPGAQMNDGDITVMLMSNLAVRLMDRGGKLGIELPAFQAIDVGQRLVQMGTEALRRHIAEIEDKPLDIAPKPKIDLVRGVSMPKPPGGF